MTITRNIPDKAPSALSRLIQRVDRALPPKAYFLLALVIIALAALAATDFSTKQPLLTEGEIAPDDVVADTSFFFKDKQATNARQELARKMQPLILDLSTMPVDTLREEIRSLLLSINEAHSADQLESLRKRISQDTGEEVSVSTMKALASPVVQDAVLHNLLPQLEQRLRTGVLPELSVTQAYPGGMIIRDLTTGEESLHPELYSLPDLKSLELQLSQQVKGFELSSMGMKAVALLFERYLRPTLIPNFELTRAKAEEMAMTVEPVMYRVLKGEMIIQKGERVSREQHIKMRMLLQRKSEPFHTKTFFGIAVLGLIISTGLLFSPSNKPSHPMANKDFVFFSVLMLLFALMAKGFAAHGAQIAAVTLKFMPESLAYAVPIAGAAALASQIFTTRRYLVTGLLLSFFCTVMMKGGLPLFLFHFLAAMWSTWLTGRSSSRQDVVLSLLPLTLGLLAMWGGATMMQGGAHIRYLPEVIAVICGSILSMILTFALSPIMEMAFGYTTRFRLMELINLEQPLLRDLMLKAPGTYHHSLIVSNMCEAGAKRVGAHSLLCKVAALYHDIGKVSKANYFIENQPYDDNPHDRLAAPMSALILISHVKQGVELAKRHRLGKEVTDIIGQHHGNSVIQYFYRKALAQKDSPTPYIEDYRYPGPKPQTREAALVMLADIVEASSRTLNDPTPTRLRQHIEDMIKNIYAAGQLDESELTFRDLSSLTDSFHQVLRGLHHHRISYPGEGQKPKAQPMVKNDTATPITASPTPQPLPAAQADTGAASAITVGTAKEGVLLSSAFVGTPTATFAHGEAAKSDAGTSDVFPIRQ